MAVPSLEETRHSLSGLYHLELYLPCSLCLQNGNIPYSTGYFSPYFNLSFPSPRDHQHHVYTCPVPSCVLVFTFMVQFLKKLLIFLFLSPHLSTFKNLTPFQIKNNKGWRCSSVTEYLTSMRKTPASISRSACLVVGKGFENLVIRVWCYLMGIRRYGFWPCWRKYVTNGKP